MRGVEGTKIPQPQATEEQSSNEYPTLKLSLSPTNPPKETTRLEKTAPTAVVKPERVKRSSTPKDHDVSPTGDSSTLSKFQKFGVRVLPDPAPRQTTENKPSIIEAEKHQNEQNLIKERVATNPFSEPHGHDTVDAEAQSDVSLHYDERAIDVGPVEMHRNLSPPDNRLVEKHQITASNDEEDFHKEHNVKHILTKGLQNLKEKLHHDKKNTGSPESPQRCKDKKQKPARHHKTSMSSDSEGLDGDRSVEGTIKSKINSREEPEKMERKRQRNPEQDNQTDMILPPSGSDIPTEIPEEVRRAAIAARSNRRSLQVPTPVTAVHEIKENDPPLSAPPARESISDSSSDEGGTDTNTDSSGRPPKRSNKRKAPPPPAEEGEHNLTNISFNGSNIEGDQNTSVLKENETQLRESNTLPTVGWNKAKNISPENIPNKSSGENEPVIPTFHNLPQQRNSPESSGKDITNITIDDGNSNILSSLTARRTADTDNARQVHAFPVDSSSSGTSTMETKTVDYEDSIHVSTVNSDSDSDLERLEGDDDEYDRKRGKKGGTTIELNSSHITIHHSPSSDTMQMAVELESDSTRKAASLGDLSRLDSEQPMSILERAVSLDLGDGGTPHSSKKRKAPLPPPGEEYLGAIQDADDSAQYRKEPRLDNAMDTFQRRRLKKSSDWGTLEEAIKQTDTSSIPSKITSTDTAHVERPVTKSNDTLKASHDGIPSEIPNLADDQKVKLSGLSQKFSDVVRAEAVNISGIEPLGSPQSLNPPDISDNAEESGRSSPECDHTLVEQDDLETRPNASVESMQQKKTVLHISPEPTKKSLEVNMSAEDTSLLPSQVTIASTSSLGLRRVISEPASHEVILTTAPEQNHPTVSPRLRTGKIISSTPLPKHERAHVSHTSPNSQNTAAEQSYIRDSLQSSLVTSSDAGISNINIVSSTQDTSSSDLDSNIIVSSATDHFVTAASFVDSTSAPEEISDNEDIWENDIQPPELPTSPVPVLTQALSSSSSFPTTPSMTYITEIQVVTTTDSENNPTIGSSNIEGIHNGTHVSSSFTQKGLMNQVDASHSSELTSNGNIELISNNEPSTYVTESNSLVSLPRSNVIVTSIRSSESTSGQSGGIVTETTNNHISEKKPKSARPPVPPRKSDLSSQSSPPSMSSSTIMVEVPKIRLTETASSSLLAGGSLSQVNPAAAGKFISFSSLSPRAEGSSTRHGSSFEQWVFLDDTSPSGHHNGFETTGTNTENGQHASVMTLPGLSPNRAQTVTHIILDTKQNSGGQVQE